MGEPSAHTFGAQHMRLGAATNEDLQLQSALTVARLAWTEGVQQLTDLRGWSGDHSSGAATRRCPAQCLGERVRCVAASGTQLLEPFAVDPVGGDRE